MSITSMSRSPPRFSPALLANLLKGHSSRDLGEKFPRLAKRWGKEHWWTSSYSMGTAGSLESRDDQAIYRAMSGQVVRPGRGRFHPAPSNGAGLPAPVDKVNEGMQKQTTAQVTISLDAQKS